MATVFIPPQMRDLTGGQAELQVSGKNLRQVVEKLNAKFPGLGERIATGDQIAAGLAVSIDGAITSRGLLAAVKPSSEIHILPALGGG